VQITHTEFGSAVTHSLKDGGEQIPVTNSNRRGLFAILLVYRDVKMFHRLSSSALQSVSSQTSCFLTCLLCFVRILNFCKKSLKQHSGNISQQISEILSTYAQPSASREELCLWRCSCIFAGTLHPIGNVFGRLRLKERSQVK